MGQANLGSQADWIQHMINFNIKENDLIMKVCNVGTNIEYL